jgi:hypothetical protein
MSGLIRGKRLVWVRDGICWRAESQFGVHYAHKSTSPDKYHWDISTRDDFTTIHEGEADTLELAQAACQADHDSRAMASVDVVPFEWSGDVAIVGAFTASIWQVPESTTWQWDIQLSDCRTITYGIEDTRDDAVNAAETFVRQLVMGVQK